MTSKLNGNITTANNETYFVERVIKKRRKGNEIQYFVKWSGWDSKFNTWEPASHLEGCEDLIEDFEMRTKRAKKRTRAGESFANVPDSSSVPGDNEKEDEKEYFVKKIVGKRLNKEGVEYFVEWEGYDESQNSWEPLKNLQHCLQLVKAFENQCKNKKVAVNEEKDVAVNTEEEVTRFDIGWEAENILGATDVDGDMKFLIKWKDRNMEELVSNKVARKWVPQMIIKFYEEHTKWID